MVTLARPKAPLVAAKSTKARAGRDLTQASGKAGLAQAFATAFYPVPVRAPPREGCSLAREQKRKGSIDDYWERRSNR